MSGKQLRFLTLVSELQFDRRLAAILCADVVGYSRMMNADEEATHADLKRCRDEIVDPKVRSYKGHIVSTAGDGILAEFVSVVDALRCALAIQAELPAAVAENLDARRICYRIGITVGDVIFDPNGIHGEGVAVATRLEGVAEPGGIAVSRAVRDQIPELLAIKFEEIGEFRAKDVARPIRAFRVVQADHKPKGTLPLAKVPDDKAGLAVLPFRNLSGQDDLGFFADSVAEDLITELSRPRWFSVTARNSSFVYKGRSVDVKQIGRELGVRYVIEGSVRAAAGRVRVACQLVEATSGTELWAERFEATLTEEFELQDRIVEAVVGAIEPTLRAKEIERAKRQLVDRLDCHGSCVLALYHLGNGTDKDGAIARQLIEHALALDPENPLAVALAAWERALAYVSGGEADEARDKAELFGRSAAAHPSAPPIALAIAGFVLGLISAERDLARAAVDHAMQMAPKSALVLGFTALERCLAADGESARELGGRALHISPFEAFGQHAHLAQAWGCLLTERHPEAAQHARAAIRGRPSAMLGHAALIAGLSLAGQQEEAREAAARLLEFMPRFSVALLRRIRLANAAFVKICACALGDAGVPS